MAKKGLKNLTQRNTFMWGWILVLPTVIGLVVLNLYPMLSTIFQSFFKTGDFGRGNTFVGLSNYSKLFKDRSFILSIGNTLKYTIIEVPISIIISLVLAQLLNGKIKGKDIYRTIFFLPMVVAPAAIAMVWKWMYNSEFGLINNIFHISVNWISSPSIAIFSIAFIGIWSDVGYNMILFIAGLQEVPTDYYEAADIDGASGFRKFYNITIPMISPMIFFVVVTRVLAALKVFDFIYMIISRANPALEKTQSLVYLFYTSAFVENEYGYSSAIVVVLLLIILLITALQLIGQKKWVHYN
ncbi:MAG: carbohydrate ABC transporter permease [Sphaerochaeta sp.]